MIATTQARKFDGWDKPTVLVTQAELEAAVRATVQPPPSLPPARYICGKKSDLTDMAISICSLPLSLICSKTVVLY